MITFKYSFISKLFYKYSIILVNLLLLLYLFFSIFAITQDWKFIFPLLINLILVYILNRYYLKIYKSFPFKIIADNEKIICSDFILKDRTLEIHHSEITKITGGIFSGSKFMPLYISTSKTKIGISRHIINYNELLKIVLSNIPKELYLNLLDNIQKNAISNKSKMKNNSTPFKNKKSGKNRT
jgi:hypothetical protein